MKTPRSNSGPGGPALGEFPVLLLDVGVDLLVVEAGERGADAVALAHFEVLAEVLVAAPPVGPDHVEALVAADLVEVGVADVVLLAVDGEAAVAVGRAVGLVGFAQAVAPVLDHALLLVFDHDPQQERLVQVEDQQQPDEPDAVLLDQRLHLPVHVRERVLEEPRDVLERTPLLRHVAGLPRRGYELCEISIRFLGKSSILLLTINL